MKNPHHKKHPEYDLATLWVIALATGQALPDRSKQLPALPTSPAKEVAHV